MPSEFDKNEKPWFFGPQRINRTETVKVLFINADSDIESKKDVIDRLSSNLKNGVINQDTGFLPQLLKQFLKMQKRLLPPPSTLSPTVISCMKTRKCKQFTFSRFLQ